MVCAVNKHILGKVTLGVILRIHVGKKRHGSRKNFPTSFFKHTLIKCQNVEIKHKIDIHQLFTQQLK